MGLVHSFGAEATEEAPERAKRAIGVFAYLAQGVRKFASLAPSSALFSADGEVVHDGEEGIVVPPRNPQALAGAIVGLIEDPDRRTTLAAGARARHGLAGRDEDPAKELPYSGVYRLAPDGSLTLLYRELARPNGLAFSPDERYLYVGNWDDHHTVVVRVGAKSGIPVSEVEQPGAKSGAPSEHGYLEIEKPPGIFRSKKYNPPADKTKNKRGNAHEEQKKEVGDEHVKESEERTQ